MSEWYEVTDKEDVEISEDGQNVDVLFFTNDWGNQYIQIPIDIIHNVLPPRKELEELKVCKNCGGELTMYCGNCFNSGKKGK